MGDAGDSDLVAMSYCLAAVRWRAGWADTRGLIVNEDRDEVGDWGSGFLPYPLETAFLVFEAGCVRRRQLERQRRRSFDHGLQEAEDGLQPGSRCSRAKLCFEGFCSLSWVEAVGGDKLHLNGWPVGFPVEKALPSSAGQPGYTDSKCDLSEN